jgi:hypothetical protein
MTRDEEPDWLPEIQRVVVRKHFIVFDREALYRHALGIAEGRDAEITAEHDDSEAGGNVEVLQSQFAEDMAHEIDPAINLLQAIEDEVGHGDHDTEIERGYAFYYSSADVDEDAEFQPDDISSPLMYHTGINVGEKLVRMHRDGSTDIVTVSKITPHCLAVEEESEGLYYQAGPFWLAYFPMQRGNSGHGDAILIGPLTNNVVPLVQS